jgi:hypothetical protein
MSTIGTCLGGSPLVGKLLPPPTPYIADNVFLVTNSFTNESELLFTLPHSPLLLNSDLIFSKLNENNK